MPLIKSAKKRAKQNEERRRRRLPRKTIMKTMLRKVFDAVRDKKKTEAQKLLPDTFKAIDMAAKNHIIHPRNAARKKANVSRAVANIA